MDFFNAIHQVEREDSWRSTALEDLARQAPFASNHGGSYSLDALWHAVGSPRRKDPGSWVRMAAPLNEGVVAYLSRLAELHGMPAGRALEWTAEDVVFELDADLGADVQWRPGDRMAIHPV